MLQNLIKVINTCGVQFHVWQDRGKETGLSWTSLIGGDKLKVLKALPDKLAPVDLVSDVKSYGRCLYYIALLLATYR